MEIILLVAVIAIILGYLSAGRGSGPEKADRRLRDQLRKRKQASQLGSKPRSDRVDASDVHEAVTPPTAKPTENRSILNASPELVYSHATEGHEPTTEALLIEESSPLDHQGDPPPALESARATIIIESNNSNAITSELPPQEIRIAGGSGHKASQERTPTGASRTRSKQSRLLAWKVGGAWNIGLEMPASHDGKLAKPCQNNCALNQDRQTERWLLTDLTTPVTFEHEAFQPASSENPVALFRCTELSHGAEAIAVANIIADGTYIAIVPDSWARNEDVCANAPIATERTSIDGFAAHYFVISRTSKSAIAFIDDKGVAIELDSSSAMFELSGNSLGSQNEEPVFFGDVPFVSAAKLSDWHRIQSVNLYSVSGEFEEIVVSRAPMEHVQTQQVCTSTIDSGSYLIELIDKANVVAWSSRFSYAKSVQGMQCDCPAVLPGPDGHGTVTTIIEHSASSKIEPFDDTKPVVLRCIGDRTELVCAGNQEADETTYRVAPDGPSFTLLLERIWWSQSELEERPKVWEDKPLKLSPKDLLATSDAGVWFRLPASRWAKSVILGLGNIKKSYRLHVADCMIFVPLRDFTDVEEASVVGEHNMQVWFERQHGLLSGALGTLEVLGKCKLCEFSTSDASSLHHHWADHHKAVLFQPPDEAQLKHIVDRLPASVFRCNGCSAEIVSRNATDPERDAQLHVERSCSASLRSGQAPTADLVATKPQMLNAISQGSMCRYCRAFCPANSASELGRHYAELHPHKVLTIVK